MSRHNLFFAPEQETGDFHSVLQQVQEYIAGQHSELLSDGNAAEAKAISSGTSPSLCRTAV
jgi:pilus assembly protein CpaF